MDPWCRRGEQAGVAVERVEHRIDPEDAEALADTQPPEIQSV